MLKVILFLVCFFYYAQAGLIGERPATEDYGDQLEAYMKDMSDMLFVYFSPIMAELENANHEELRRGGFSGFASYIDELFEKPKGNHHHSDESNSHSNSDENKDINQDDSEHESDEHDSDGDGHDDDHGDDN